MRNSDPCHVCLSLCLLIVSVRSTFHKLKPVGSRMTGTDDSRLVNGRSLPRPSLLTAGFQALSYFFHPPTLLTFFLSFPGSRQRRASSCCHHMCAHPRRGEEEAYVKIRLQLPVICVWTHGKVGGMGEISGWRELAMDG